MLMSLIIGVDTGNRCIKTANHVFVSGVKKSNVEMPFQQGVLKFNDNYYMLSQERVIYLQDKTESEEYFVLALYAIAKELETRGIATDNVIPISLGLGLPPSHLPRLKDKFKKYFNRGQVSFIYNKKLIQIDIQDVSVFSQGYAAIFMDYEQISKFNKSYIVDIGGYTTDVISLTHGRIDPDFCESLDMGLIQLYNRLTRQIHKKYGRSPSESQIDEMISEGREILPDYQLMSIVNFETNAYITELMRKLSEYGIDLKFSKGIFVGGGAERFKNWIEKSEYVSEPYFITNVHANAQGYEAFLNSLNNQG